jgi:hypothetical protein
MDVRRATQRLDGGVILSDKRHWEMELGIRERPRGFLQGGCEQDVNEFADQLIAVVAEEAEQCERMLTLLRQQQRRLIECDTAGIESNVRDQEAAIRRSHELEKRRLGLVQQLEQAAGVNGESSNIERLVAVLSDDYGRRLRQLRESLGAAIGRIEKVRQQNTVLIERSLSNIGETMRLLATVPPAGGHTVSAEREPAVAMPVSVDRIG